MSEGSSSQQIVAVTKTFGLAIVTALLFCPIVVGCQSPKAANKSNFAKAITANYAEYPFCINGTMDDQFAVSYFMAPGAYSPNVEMDKLLVRAGLLTLVSQNTEANPNGLASMMVLHFALTPIGRQFYKQGKGFCYGTPVVQIIDFTDPGPNGTATEVTFKYRLHGVPTWLTGELAQEFRNSNGVSKSVYEDVQGRALLTLMGSGWKLQRFGD